MASVICKVLKDIEIGILEKVPVHDEGKSKFMIDKDSKIMPVVKLNAGIRVQLKHGFNSGTEQKVYIASKQYGSGWFETDNKNGYSLNEVFAASRKSRSPWEAMY